MGFFYCMGQSKISTRHCSSLQLWFTFQNKISSSQMLPLLTGSLKSVFSCVCYEHKWKLKENGPDADFIYTGLNLERLQCFYASFSTMKPQQTWLLSVSPERKLCTRIFRINGIASDMFITSDWRQILPLKKSKANMSKYFQRAGYWQFFIAKFMGKIQKWQRMFMETIYGNNTIGNNRDTLFHLGLLSFCFLHVLPLFVVLCL